VKSGRYVTNGVVSEGIKNLGQFNDNLTMTLDSAGAACFSNARGAGSSPAIFMKMSAVLSLSVVVVISPGSAGAMCEKSSSR